KVVDILSNSPKPPRGPSKQHSSSDLSSDPDSIAYSLEQTNRVLLRKTSFSTSDEDLQLNDNNEFLIFSFEAHPYLYNGLTRFDSTDQDQSTELDEKEWIEQMEINKRRYS